MNKSILVDRVAGGRRAAYVALCLIPATCIHAADSSNVEEIVVTGSRIARASDFDSPSPVITVDRGSIEKSGYSNLQQLMEKMPGNGNGSFSTRGNNQDSTANGAASISLRGLGADATLVLVNGRRVAINAFAENVTTNFVDINSIPVAAIERVEVLKDGSSAVYGSDAVAGVVNVILRKDFDGFEASAGYGSADGYDEFNASAVWGIAGENSNVTMILDYFKNTSLFNTERGSLGSANQTAKGGEDFRSSRSVPGNFVINGTQRRVDPACPPDRTSVSAQRCLYDFGIWNVLIPEAERTGFMLMASQEMGAVELFGELAVQHNTSFAQGAPTPLDAGAGLTAPPTHPGNPFPGATSILIDRFRTVDAGPRQWDIETNNVRGVVGLRGSFGDWNWEAAAQKARSKSEQTGDRSMGWVRTDFLQTEINAGRYNPFGGAVNPQSTVDAITTSLVRQGESDFTMYDAQITGDLFDLPAGAVKMAAGAEYRDESISDIPDDQFVRGLIFGTESVSAAAARDSWAMYVEFSVPVLESLELSLAARYDDYSDFGDTTNPKLAVRWSPIDSLALRASWGTGFRAPSLAQIGLGPSQESLFFIDSYGCAQDPAACDVLDYTVIYSGNPNLKAEESETLNLGVAWKPTESTEVTLDYWDIKQENKIDKIWSRNYVQFCDDQNSTVCVRDTPLPGDTLGGLQSVVGEITNIGEQNASGIDLGGYVGFGVGPGRMTFGLLYSHLLEFERVELADDGVTLVSRALEGEYEYPEDRAQLTADWGTDAWGVFASVNYIGPFQDTPDADFNGQLDYDQVDTRDVGDFTTVNLQLRYTGLEGATFLLGVDNVFDEMPPFAVGDGDADVYGYVQNVHNPRGRFWNARVTYRF